MLLLTGVSTSSAIAVLIATCCYPVRSKEEGENVFLLLSRRRSREEGENIVEMAMMVIQIITPFIAHQCVCCSMILSMMGKGEYG